MANSGPPGTSENKLPLILSVLSNLFDSDYVMMDIYVCLCVCVYIYIYIYIYSHSHSHNHLSCRLLELPGISRRQVVPASMPWVPGLPEVAHSMTEDPEDRGYRSTRLWGQWRLQSVSISNGDGRWPVCSPGVRGQGTSMQQHRNKQKAKASPSGAKRQPRHKAARMRRSKSGLSVVRVPPPPWTCPVPVTPRNPLPVAYS